MRLLNKRRSVHALALAVVAISIVACGDDSNSPDETARELASLTRSFGTGDAKRICELSANDCGRTPNSSLDRDPVAVAVHDLQRAFLDGDAEAVCSRVTKKAQIQAGSMAHGTPSTCSADVRRAFQLFDVGNGWQDAENPKVTAVRKSGDRAIARVAVKGRQLADVPFVKVAGKWKLDSFFGSDKEEVPQFVDSAEQMPFPRASGREVRVSDKRGACSEVSAAEYPTISGGCDVQVLGEKIEMTVMTPFGSFKFGDCLVSYQMKVDASGRTRTYFFTVDGPLETGCGDVNPCANESLTETAVWKGRIERADDGQLVHRVSACLDTCVGAFVGELEIRMVPQAGRWRAEYVDADVGTSGFRLNGDLGVKPAGLELEPTR